MPASAPSAGVAPSSAPSGPVGVGSNADKSVVAVAPLLDGEKPSVGTRWRERYDIIEALPAGEGEQRWRGRLLDDGREVILHGFKPAEPDVRAQAWAKLGGIDSPHLQRPRDAQRAGEVRIEVADAPAGVTLSAWRAQQPEVAPGVAKAMVAQLAEGLAAMHAFELVHLRLSPEAIFVHEKDGALTWQIAGLDGVTSFDRKEPVPVAVDPFYAPPEAQGLSLHVPGPGLCAWDWWSLGRVVQECILGQHIAGVDKASPQTRVKAEELLIEGEAKGPRAGAVEQMKDLDAGLTLLLRGLLTSAKESRWTNDNVDRWVRGLPVKEHYDAPRAETHFRWRGRPCSVPEMAGILQTAEHWAETSVQLFEPTTPGTLAHFLKWSPNLAAANEQLTTALELKDSLPLKLCSPAAQREAVTIVALTQLSGKLVWRGRAFESGTVAAILAELGEADGLMVLRALTTRSTALQIERIDTVGGRTLTELGRVAGDVENLLRRYSWLAQNDVAETARLYRLALEPIPALRTLRDTLGQGFAGSDHPAMEKMFKAQNLGRVELVALAWASAAPERFKFYTHAEAARRRAEALRARGVEIMGALIWVQFERALNVGRLVFSGWGWFILGWTLIGALALLVIPGPRALALIPAPLICALFFRMLFSGRNARALRAVVPDAVWTWRDGPARCRRELRLAGRGATRKALEAELASVRQELGSLTAVQPPPAPLPSLPRFRGVRVLAAASWLLLIACLGGVGWRLTLHRPTVKELKTAWAPMPEKKPEPEKQLVVKPKEEEGEVKIAWPFRPGEDAFKLSVRVTQAASSAQVEYATKHGRELARPYRPDTINTLIIMPVPPSESNAVMIFDGKRGELANQQVYLLEFRPIPRTWVELAGRKGVFLDH